MNRWRMIWSMGQAIVSLALSLALIGCGERPPPAPPPRVAVVASVYPLADVAHRIGGGAVDVEWWIESGQSVRGFTPTSTQLDALRNAAVVLIGGVNESDITRNFAARFDERRLIRLDSFVSPEQRVEQLWLDPAVVKQLANALAVRFSALDPADAPLFRSHAKELVGELNALTDEFDAPLSGLRGQFIASLGSEFSALARPFGFEVTRLSEQSALQATPEQVRAIAKVLKQRGAILLLIEADTPENVQRNLQSAVDVPVIAIDSLGSSSASARDSYPDAMRYNYEQLAAGYRKALKR